MTQERYQKISNLTTGSRKISISPVAPSSGIKTGVVMAYGHIIPAPYGVDYSSDNRLRINGVQVRPSLVKERHRREHPLKTLSSDKQELQQQAGELILAARKVYDERKSGEAIAQLHQRVLDMLGQNSDLIQQPNWQKEVLCYTTPAYGPGQCVNFDHSASIPTTNQAAIETKNKADEIAQIEMNLKEGKWVCFGSMGGMSTMRNPRAAVNQIMTDSSLTNKQKADKLKEQAFHSYDLALDVVENFDATEWRETK